MQYYAERRWGLPQVVRWHFLKPLVLPMVHAAIQQFQQDFRKLFSLLHMDDIYHLHTLLFFFLIRNSGVGSFFKKITGLTQCCYCFDITVLLISEAGWLLVMKDWRQSRVAPRALFQKREINEKKKKKVVLK